MLTDVKFISAHRKRCATFIRSRKLPNERQIDDSACGRRVCQRFNTQN